MLCGIGRVSLLTNKAAQRPALSISNWPPCSGCQSTCGEWRPPIGTQQKKKNNKNHLRSSFESLSIGKFAIIYFYQPLILIQLPFISQVYFNAMFTVSLLITALIPLLFCLSLYLYSNEFFAYFCLNLFQQFSSSCEQLLCIIFTLVLFLKTFSLNFKFFTFYYIAY